MADPQDRLFVLAKDALVVSASYLGGQGWHVVITSRRQGQTWDEAESARYDHLTSAELLDVLYVELEHQITG